MDYNIRAKLINPNNLESDWELNTDLKAVTEDKSEDTPGFGFSLIIIVLSMLIIRMRYNKKKKR